MKIGASELWRWEGTIERGPYLLVGILGFALKHNLDRLVATVLFGRPWTVFNYWIAPTEALPISRLPRQDQLFFATLLVLALPFIWVGLVLTLKRLRPLGCPPGWSCSSFCPSSTWPSSLSFVCSPRVPDRIFEGLRAAGESEPSSIG